MEFKVEHPHFVENKITWEISGLKSTLKYAVKNFWHFLVHH